MRILTLATEFPPAHGYGLGRYVAAHTAALAAEGHEVSVACSNWDAGLQPGTYERAGVEVNNAPSFIPIKGYTWIADVLQSNVLLEARAIEMARRTGGFDLIQVHDWLSASAAKSLRDLLQIPLVVTMHDTMRGRKQGQLNAEDDYIANMESWICEQADAVLTNSHFIERELIEAYRVPEDKLSVVGCGVDPSAFGSDTDPRLFRSVLYQGSGPMVAFVGRLTESKGPHVLLEAAQHVLRVQPETRFFLAGDGSMRQALEQQAVQLGISDRVHFASHLRGQVLATFYRAADTVVVPSLYEPFGMVALEAMVCGTPVIASDTGGLSEIMANGDCALPAPPNDRLTLARAILHLLENPERGRQLRERAREVVAQRYQWSDVARRTITAYERTAVCVHVPERH